MGLELRPSCEHCNRLLPPHSTEAMICSFECTYCKDCAQGVLSNVCPNCGGGFEARPIRPSRNHKGNNFLGAYPASVTVKFRPADMTAHKAFATILSAIPPAQR